MENYYFKSTEIKVYPCSYRGEYNGTEIFDPESRAASEYNLIHTGNFSDSKNSYILGYSNNVLSCVVGGYYFEISNFVLNTIKTIIGFDAATENTKWYLCIKTEDTVIKEDDETDCTRKTKLLSSYTGSNSVDINVAETGAADWRFVGLTLVDGEHIPESSTYSLAILYKKVVGETKTLEFCNEAFEPKISRGSVTGSGTETTIVIGGSDNSGSHKNIAIGRDAFASGSDTQAKADYSSTFGKGTVADRQSMMAVGEYNDTTEEDDLFVVGSGNSTTKETAFKVNKNKVNISKATTINGNTTITGTASITGDTDITGNIDITGNEAVSGDFAVATDKFKITASSGNVDIKGKIEVVNDEVTTFKVDNGEITNAGSIHSSGKVYSAGAEFTDQVTISNSNKFTVDANGNVLVDGTAEIGKTGGTVSLSKAGSQTEVKGNLKVDGTADIDGTFRVKPSSTGGDPAFIVTTDGDTTVKRNESVYGTFTQKGVADIGKDAADVTGTNARSAVKIGKPEATTEILGKAKFDSSVELSDDVELKTAVGSETEKTTKFSLDECGNEYIHGNLKMESTSNAYLPNEANVKFGGESGKTLTSMLRDALYPIGSIYTSVSATKTGGCPIAATLGGTWARIEDTFLYAAKDNDPVCAPGTEGGNNNAALITHFHDMAVKDGEGNHTHTIDNKTQKLDIDCRRLEGNQKVIVVKNQVGVTVEETEYSPDVASLDYQNKHWMGKWKLDFTHKHGISGAGTHSHSITQQYASCDNSHSYSVAQSVKYTTKDEDGKYYDKDGNEIPAVTGVNANMPKFIAVYVWKRIA